MTTAPPTVAAIIPAYNEGIRLRPVLDAIVRCPRIQEIIVVDDGSREQLDWISAEYPNVRLIRHEQNRGKGAAMETGVRATSAEYIFFCDADLVGFLPEHASVIIEPVVTGTYDMYIGLRNNFEQRAVFLFALNSGERCLRHSDWEALSHFYKKRYRVEAGLNFLIAKRGGRLGYQVFPYRQTLRERKYGFWTGVRSRMQLSFEVLSAWLYIISVDYWV